MPRRIPSKPGVTLLSLMMLTMRSRLQADKLKIKRVVP